MTLRRFVFKSQFDGLPKHSDFELVEEPIREPAPNEVVLEALYLSVDPYMRVFARNVPTGGTMFGTQVAKVTKSKHPGYKEGDLVVGHLGWASHSVVNPDQVKSFGGEVAKPYILPDLGGVSPSTGLGVLGMPGNTAWFGLTKLCQPKPGETLVVTGAAGAVGSLVGQIGKILGLKVIGFAGTDEKVQWLEDDLKFDRAFNYKTVSVTEALKEAAPEGVDCYFDNVGGEMSSDVMNQMNTYGRVAVCGSISAYNATTPVLAPIVQPTIITKQLTLTGFVSSRWKDCWFEGIQQMLHFIQEDKLVVRESIVEGFEKMPDAFISLFTGDNTGKVVVKA
ncbi:hypothetical protein GE061_011914 [Apolygus lucorum]|uniref:Prostaglandin reductase 1 n=1 Tax=Apolygus lucorum TaxID=248454 RepID=A0A6A4JUS1_APOLU|nr:hypothetical protein GE061_011914 [Apolygus lucorum]